MHHVRSWGIVIVCFLGACEDGGSSLGPLYAPCTTTDDCSVGTPECVAFDLGVGASRAWCTSTCSFDGDCYFDVGVGSAGGCVGVNGSHQLDPASPTRYCLELCDPARPGCQPSHACVAATYDGQSLAYCVPDGS